MKFKMHILKQNSINLRKLWKLTDEFREYILNQKFNGVMILELDETIVNRLKDKIVEKENKNLSTKEMTDTKMIEWIKKEIEAEVHAAKIRNAE